MKIQWHLTDACNQNCKFCYQNSHSLKNTDMRFGDIAKTINAIKEYFLLYLKKVDPNCTLFLDFTGGEPFMHPDFINLLHLCETQKEWFRYGILTNGTMIDNKRAEILVSTGCSRVQVSIDGLEETHDKLRCKGNFKKVLDKISLLRSYNIFTIVSFTATTENYKEFPGVAKAVYEAGGNGIWSDRVLPIDTNKNIDHLLLSPEQTKKYIKLMRDTRDYFDERGLPFIVSLERALQFIYGGGSGYSCNAGKSLLTIMPNGDVYPCRRLPIVVGNVYTDNLWDIYQGDILTALRTNKPTVCSNCSHNNKCAGGLRCLSYAMTGDPFSGDPGCPIQNRPN